MPCYHKFYDELHLERIDYEPETLIVGTFNPGGLAGNTAEWFYGRTDSNYLWEVLPRLYGAESLVEKGPEDWKLFCRERKIAMTDLIAAIEDAEMDDAEHRKILGGYSDKAIVHHFDDFEFVDVLQLLRRFPTVKQVYLTRGITEAFWRHLWTPVMRYCDSYDIHERRLLTPSGNASYQHGQHNNLNPDGQVEKLEDYILMRWRNEWHLAV